MSDTSGDGPLGSSEDEERWMVVVHGIGVPRTVLLPDRGAVTIGRGSASTVLISHRSVSGQHALLRIDRVVTIEDLGSTNGTYHRGERLPPHQARELAVDEGVIVGSVYVVLQRGEPPDAQRSALPARRATGDVRGTARIATTDAPALVVCEPSMRELHALVHRFAGSPLPALLVGENGVGKHTLARVIHRRSALSEHPFVRISCAAHTEHALASVLIDSGVIAGGQRTVFLDDVAALSPALQTRLLHAIEDADQAGRGARLIAASPVPLEDRVRDGAFRDELYFRLSAATLTIPPLRDRRSEIEPLARAFLAAACTRLERAPATIADDALAALRARAWPGNLNELRAVVERATVLAGVDEITAHHLVSSRSAAGKVVLHAYPPATEDRERQELVDALVRTNGNQADAARLLGISRRTLINRLERYKLPRPRKRI